MSRNSDEVFRELSVYGDDIKSGDKVYYRRCFGRFTAVFVGMCDALQGDHNCVLVYNGLPCGAVFKDVEKVLDHKQVEDS